MSDIIRQAHNIKLKYSKTRKLTTDLFIQVIDLILLANGGESNKLTAAEIVKKLEALTGNSRLRASAIRDIEIGTETLGLTADDVRDLLQTLLGDARLSAKALSDLNAEEVLINSPIVGLNNVQDIIFYILGEISKYEPDLGLPDEDGQFLSSLTDGTRSWQTVKQDSNFIWEQTVASMIWEFNHPLEKIPVITCIKSDGKRIRGAENKVTETEVQILWNTPILGKAILN